METKLNNSVASSFGNKKLGLKEKISYGFGEIASSFIWGTITSYLLFFYTDVFGITASAAGTLFLITRIWDAVNDPLMGIIVDRTKSKHGKARPYLLYMAIPFAIISILTFITPDFSHTGKLVYAYITYTSLGMVYTAINLPYGSMMPMMTLDSKERADLGSIRTIGLGIGTIIISASVLPLVNLLGNGNSQLGFPITMAIFAIIGTVLFFTAFKNCKERYTKPQKNSANLIKSIIMMLKNQPWLMVAIVSVFKYLKLGALNAVVIYYVTYVMEKPLLAPVFLVLLNVGTLGGGILAFPILRKMGNKIGTQAALTAGTLLFILLIFIPNNNSVSVMVLFAAVFMIANVLVDIDNPAIIAMLADTIDYHEWKFGERLEGLLYSSYSFATKFGVAIGSSFVAYALAFVNYDPSNITQDVRIMLGIIFFGAPILLTILQIITLCFYKLDKYHEKIVSEINR